MANPQLEYPSSISQNSSAVNCCHGGSLPAAARPAPRSFTEVFMESRRRISPLSSLRRLIASAHFIVYGRGGMQEKFDVAVIGGAFSGAATALLLRREAPELSVAIIERSAHFDRKVGEATTEVSGCFLTKRLALTHHLCHHHVVKNGLRFWFSRGPEDEFDRCSEIGAFYQVRLPSYQVDREVLDEHVLTPGLRSRRPALPARQAYFASNCQMRDFPHLQFATAAASTSFSPAG